jgi:hypothetical protein
MHPHLSHSLHLCLSSQHPCLVRHRRSLHAVSSSMHIQYLIPPLPSSLSPKKTNSQINRANHSSCVLFFSLFFSFDRYTNEGDITGPFLVETGIASVRMQEIEEMYNEGPCVRVPSLQRAWEESTAYLETLDSAAKRDLINYRRRLRGALYQQDIYRYEY